MKIDARELAMLLFSLGDQSGPMYQRLANGLADLIRRGDLPSGCLLPSERDLAAELHVSRTTVVATYRELQESGEVERRKGSGTRVSSAATGRERETVGRGAISNVRLASQFLYGPAATIDFATAALPALPMVAETAAAIEVKEYRKLLARNHTYDPRGLLELRTAVARRYTDEGVPTTEAEILITSGAQHAIEVIAEGCLQPGDTVVVEAPTYRGALEAFGRAGNRIEGVRLDADGLVVGELEQVLRSRHPRLIYVQSQVHNPSGTCLAPDRRIQLIDLAAAHGLIVVDDRSLADTSFGPGTPLLAGKGDSPTVITIGSMNKLFWSGLRVGWIRADAEVVSRLAKLKGRTDVGTSIISQHISVRLLDDLEAARTERQAGLRHSYGVASRALGELLPDWTWWEPRGGPSVWVELPHGDAAQFASLAMRYGVALLPAAVFVPEGIGNRHVRFQYALPEKQLTLGIDRLAEAWAAFVQHGSIETPVRSAFT